MTPAPLVAVSKLHKSYGQVPVLQGIDLTVLQGQVVCLIGPSGSGKSTLLRCLNLLEKPDSGSIQVGEFDVTSPGVDSNRMRQKMGMVFQQFNLFSHLSVEENCTIAQTKVLKRSKEEARAKALENLAKVGLADQAQRRPHQLSGGQQQRVAIARSLSMDPQLMLFDEPTSALDPETVGDVLAIMRQLANEGMTMVVVTHEMSFARDIADWVIFMDAGRVVEEGHPHQVIGNPQQTRTQNFLARILHPAQVNLKA